MRRIRDRLFVGIHAPGSVLWVLVAIVLAVTLWSALVGDGDLIAEGLFSMATIIGVIWIWSRVEGWPFWPWR